MAASASAAANVAGDLDEDRGLIGDLTVRVLNRVAEGLQAGVGRGCRHEVGLARAVDAQATGTRCLHKGDADGVKGRATE